MGSLYPFYLLCEKCRSTYSPSEPVNLCKKCGSFLEVQYDKIGGVDEDLFRKACSRKLQSIWKYKELLPHPVRDENIVSLGEGCGNLLYLSHVSAQTGLKVYARYYGSNPTGTHKDLGMSVAVSIAKEIGVKSAVTFSTGNAGTSLAAYCAAADIRATVITRETISREKLANILAFGATVVVVRNLRDPWSLLNELSSVVPVYYFTNFINPYRAEGHKTLAYDIFVELKETPISIYEPLGTGGGIWGTWKGFRELRDMGLIGEIPKINGVQPEAVKHAVVAYEKGEKTAAPYGDGGLTKIHSLADPVPLLGDERPLKAIYDSRGKAIAVTDEEAKEALLMLGRDGLFVEPAAACSLAGLLKDVQAGVYDRGDTVVLSLTGTGLKQPDFSLDRAGGTMFTLERPDIEFLKRCCE